MDRARHDVRTTITARRRLLFEDAGNGDMVAAKGKLSFPKRFLPSPHHPSTTDAMDAAGWGASSAANCLSGKRPTKREIKWINKKKIWLNRYLVPDILSTRTQTHSVLANDMVELEPIDETWGEQRIPIHSVRGIAIVWIESATAWGSLRYVVAFVQCFRAAASWIGDLMLHELSRFVSSWIKSINSKSIFMQFTIIIYVLSSSFW